MHDSLRPDSLALQWAALQQAGGAAAALAGIVPEPEAPAVRDFPAHAVRAGGRRLERAVRGMSDLAAIMELGLAALLTIRQRGADAHAAAHVLWREFVAARAALLKLVLPAALDGSDFQG